MSQFGQCFNDWVGDKRRILTDDKENYLKTLAEESGKNKISIIFIVFTLLLLILLYYFITINITLLLYCHHYYFYY